MASLPNSQCMETSNSPNENTKPTINVACIRKCIKSMPKNLKSKAVETVKFTKKIGEDDPRRIVHSVKVGLALTLVSSLYFFRPLYAGFGQAGMWAILTVVLVFEFTVGGTLSKSLNRGCATLLAGALGIGAEYLANLCGDKGEPIVLGLMVFILATSATFTRFFPDVKRRYDYGVLIFIITFTLVAVSGFRVSEILALAHQRLSTILIGGATCILISIFVCPVWAGQDLHYLIAANIEKIALFLEGFGGEFMSFPENEDEKSITTDKDKSFLVAYKSVLNSKTTEETLANLAWWEPCHGQFRFRHPWGQYLKTGALATECAHHIKIIHKYVYLKPQVTSELIKKIQEPCRIISTESSQALKQLSSSIKNMTFPLPETETHIRTCNAAANDLKIILEKPYLPDQDHSQETIQLLFLASVLIDIVKSVENISVSVNELSQKAGFRQQNPKAEKQQHQLLHRGIVQPVNNFDISDNSNCVVIDVHKLAGGQETLAQAMEREKLETRS
ncbi:aluminum-activated malate transporter 8-like [Primulina huaijiensis]|uniref:aluminum-activated malate transporter 8-like n=1 Tax=Primulina huaijiensis TaxID=1492673 RepID=UPI003CC77FDF